MIPVTMLPGVAGVLGVVGSAWVTTAAAVCTADGVVFATGANVGVLGSCTVPVTPAGSGSSVAGWESVWTAAALVAFRTVAVVEALRWCEVTRGRMVNVAGVDAETVASDVSGMLGTTVGSGTVGVVVGSVSAGGLSVVDGSVDVAVDGESGSVIEVFDVAVALVEAVVLISAPPELCTIPERGSAVVEWESADDVEEFADDVDPGDDESVAESAVELEVVDEDESDEDESEDVEVPESDGPATATPGQVATATPKPTAKARPLTRDTHFAGSDLTICAGVRFDSIAARFHRMHVPAKRADHAGLRASGTRY